MTFVFMGGEIDNSWAAWKNQAKSLNRESIFWKSISLLCRRMTAMIALYILFIQLICAFPRPPISSLLSLSKTSPHSQFTFHVFNTWPFYLPCWTFNTNWFLVYSSNSPLLFMNVFQSLLQLVHHLCSHFWAQTRQVQDTSRYPQKKWW